MCNVTFRWLGDVLLPSSWKLRLRGPSQGMEGWLSRWELSCRGPMSVPSTHIVHSGLWLYFQGFRCLPGHSTCMLHRHTCKQNSHIHKSLTRPKQKFYPWTVTKSSISKQFSMLLQLWLNTLHYTCYYNPIFFFCRVIRKHEFNIPNIISALFKTLSRPLVLKGKTKRYCWPIQSPPTL